MSKLPFCLLAIALPVCLAACAGDPERERSPIAFKVFDDADTNHDGKLDREEVAAVPGLQPLLLRFDRIDSDHSGFLSWNEVRAARFPIFRPPPLPGQRE
jgi:Ca2+-binding EF-hand superfamily protein